MTTIYAAKKPRFEKIEKVDGPAPGLYKVEEAMNKTFTSCQRPVIDKSANVSFIDVHTKL